MSQQTFQLAFYICAPLWLVFIFIFPNIGLAETYIDSEAFDEDAYFSGTAFWTHDIPHNSSAKTAEIKLNIRVSQFNDWGVLDLFCSNSNTFDYGSATQAPTKPGFVRRIVRADAPDSNAFYEITGTLSQNQLEWLNDDGNIHIALIGVEYRHPAYGGYRAFFYLKLSDLTADIEGDGAFSFEIFLPAITSKKRIKLQPESF
jgi:hypothetical protein